jgi:hypothetical protein
MRNSVIKTIVILIAGIAIGVLAMWGYNATQGVTPRVIEGYSSGTNHNGTAIGISKEEGGTGASEGYRIGGAMWREFGGPWHQDGSPPSLEWPSYGQKIRMGVIDYRPTDNAFGSTAVVWLEVIDTKYMVKE